MEEVEYELCVNCKKEIPHKNYVMHTAHCARNITLCPDCKEPVPKASFEEHKRRHGAIKKAPAASPKPVSNGTTTWRHQPVNSEPPPVLGHSASKGLLACKYCDLELPKLDLEEHEGYCGSRTDKCNECGEFVMFKYKKLHEDSNHGFIKLSDEPGPRASWDSMTTRTASSTAASDALYSRRSTLPPLRPFDMTPLYDMMDYMPPSNTDLAGSMRSKRKEQQEYKDMSRRLDCKTEYIKNLLHDSASITVPLRSSGTAPRNHFYHDRDIGTSSSEAPQSGSATPRTHYNHNKDPVTNSTEPSRSNVPVDWIQTRGGAKLTPESRDNWNTEGAVQLLSRGRRDILGGDNPGIAGGAFDELYRKNASGGGKAGGPFDEYKGISKKSQSNFVENQDVSKKSATFKSQRTDNKANFNKQRTNFSNFDNLQGNRGNFHNQKPHNYRKSNQRGNFHNNNVNIHYPTVGDNFLFPRDNFYNPNIPFVDNRGNFANPKGNNRKANLNNTSKNASRKSRDNPQGNLDNFHNPNFKQQNRGRSNLVDIKCVTDNPVEPADNSGEKSRDNPRGNLDNFHNPTFNPHNRGRSNLVDIKCVTDNTEISTLKGNFDNFNNPTFNPHNSGKSNLVDIKYVTDNPVDSTLKVDKPNRVANPSAEAFPNDNFSWESSNNRKTKDKNENNLVEIKAVTNDSVGTSYALQTRDKPNNLSTQQNSNTLKANYSKTLETNYASELLEAFADKEFKPPAKAICKFELPNQPKKSLELPRYELPRCFSSPINALGPKHFVDASKGPSKNSKGAKPKTTGPAPQPPHRRRNPPTELTIPCEFCDTPIPHEELIQHETGCRPDLARFNPRRRSPEDDDYFVAPPAAQQPASPEVELPCEFCSDLIPASQLLIHQAKCN